MVKRNSNISKLKSNYLFPEINARKKEFLKKNPEASLISLGIGDTTEPIPHSITEAMKHAAHNLSSKESYSGYGPEQGSAELRERIAKVIYHGKVDADEIFISDGSKCDIGRLQFLFGCDATMAVQDPSYPVYVDSSVMMGLSGKYDSQSSKYDKLIYMPCNPENQFFPDLKKFPRTDIIYFCSPNNPTGAVATKEQLKALIKHAKENRSIIIYDSAYAAYIRDPHLPKTIFELEGAKEVALETSSFSKIAGFTGVRLGWTVVPKALKYEDGSSVRDDWNRIMCTIFNGASNISQAGALAALEENGQKELKKIHDFYFENASILKKALEKKGLKVYGGGNAPYLWVHFPGMKSWDLFQKILEKGHIVTTPGSGFGPAGEGFIRFSAFGHRENILRAEKILEHLNFH